MKCFDLNVDERKIVAGIYVRKNTRWKLNCFQIEFTPTGKAAKIFPEFLMEKLKRSLTELKNLSGKNTSENSPKIRTFLDFSKIY